MSDSDKIFLRGETIVDGTGVLPAQGNSWIANDVMLGRARWTTGATVLQQPDCQPGAWQIQPGDRILRHWRLDGTATADDAARLLLSTPIRGTWHSDDNSGATPALDNRVVKGDSCQIDTGSGDSYELHYDGSRFRGYGVLAESRDLATAIAPTKSSDAVTLRGSYYNSGAKWMDWRWRNFTPTSSAGTLRLYAQHEGGTEQLRFQFISGTSATFEIYGTTPDNIVPGIRFNSYQSGGAAAGVVCGTMGVGDGETDGVAVWFQHGDPARRALWRYRPSNLNATGGDSVVLAGAYRDYATLGDALIHSGGVGWIASYFDGADPQEATAYSQLILTGTDPTGYVEHGFDFGSGISRLYNHGLLAVAGSSTGGLLLSRYDSADVSDPMLDSPPLTLRASSMGISGAEDREFKLTCFVGSPADEGDVWALVYNNGNADVGGVLHDGSRMVGDAAANVLSFTLGAGTHPAVNSGTTKATPGTVDAWMVLDVNGTTYYSPLYTSKTA